MSVCKTREIYRAAAADAEAARAALICSLPSPGEGPDSCTPSPSLGPPLAGASLSSPAGEGDQVKWAIAYSGTGTLRGPALWNACSLCQINTPSFLSTSEIDSEGGKCAWERRFSVFVCARVRAWGEGRVLAAHLMIFSVAVYWLSECCWRKMETALHKVKRHAILL